MIKVHILVEGQTEEEFVKEILRDYLSPRDIYLNPIIAKTRQAIGGSPAYRGGIVSYGKIEIDLKPLLYDSSAALVTTMIDFYRLPSDFPGFKDDEAQKGAPHNCVKYLEQKLSQAISHPKFLPYISLHEFEALLFSDCTAIVQQVRGQDETIESSLKSLSTQYNNPEEINKDEPPSKRIQKYLSEYNKVVHGSLIAIEIGVDKMRQHCPHFHEWLTNIEALTSQ